MKVFGIYNGDFDGWYLQQPLYYKREDAITEALLIVNKQQEDVVLMQEHCNKKPDVYNDEYKDWHRKEDGKDTWVGGYMNEYTVSVEEIEIV